jgi:uncharacterized protein with ParB-like and HNH nuclease domain
MQASETKLQQILEGTRQYVVPLFQRPYSWKVPEWEALWNDILCLCEVDKARPHFMGSIVTMPTTSSPEQVSKYLLIDGQQRLTTIFILLSALRDTVKHSEEELAKEINDTILVNPFKKKNGSDYYKLQPTQVDRMVFHQIINSDSSVNKTGISECYDFFKKKIKKIPSSSELQKIKEVICGSFSVVSVVLNADDDPYLVFESLNAKGRPLTQADLIRNYLFMRIPGEDQERIHAEYWQPMQDLLGDNLTEFIRHYLTKSGSDVKQREIYFEIKDRINKSDALSYLKHLHIFSEYYSRLSTPEREPKDIIRKYLCRLNRLDVVTVYPFLLNCYDDCVNQRLTEEEFVSVLKVLENFILRRFVCNIQTRGLNRIFALLHSKVSKATALGSDNFVDRLKLTLQDQDYPKDAEFKARLIDVKLYGGKRSEKCKIILESIEEYFGHKEQVRFENLSIEHIMPQNLSDSWKKDLGEEWEKAHELLLDTLGNLTLTAYNGELSNDSFKQKKQTFRNSNLELNKYFQSPEEWREEDIKKRADYLADIALQIWGYFGDESAQSSPPTKLKGTTPKAVFCSGKQYPVKSWRDVLETTLNEIADLEPNSFNDIVQKFTRFISWDRKNFRETRTLRNGAFIEVNLSSQDIYKFYMKAIETAELSHDEWRIETQDSR